MAAFQVLADEGVDKIRVERLARQLKVTKGSFYWHFRDRDELLDAVLEYWSSAMTQTALEHAQAFTGSALERIFVTARRVVGDELSAMDPAVRSWAKHDARAERVVRRIDKLRLTFLTRLLNDAGFVGEEAELRVRLLLYYMLGDALMFEKEPLRDRNARIDQRVRILLSLDEDAVPG